MGCRTSGLSDQWAVGPMGCRTNGLSEYWDVIYATAVPRKLHTTFYDDTYTIGNDLPSIGCPTITYTYIYNYISHDSINLSSMN